MERVTALIAAARAASMPLSIALVDLDNFKSVNDRFGHAAGDRALACFASVIATAIGPRDVFGRLGSEEFAVLFVSKDEAEAQRYMDQLRAVPAASPSNDSACTFSAGVRAAGSRRCARMRYVARRCGAFCGEGDGAQLRRECAVRRNDRRRVDDAVVTCGKKTGGR
jgi:diguanylate cyclase (GGDEF)-like protein